jgi:Domain of unknown function (DUF4373)
MKWFKHDADASNDAKLKKLRLKYGAQGYGIYWYCLELIARNVEKHNLTFELEHDAELIADDFKLSNDLVQHIMTYMIDLGLFESSNGIITCLKMANRTDEYTQQLMRDIKRTPESVPIISNTVPIISEVIEQNRTEQNIKNITPLKMLMAMGVNENLAKDWIRVRKEKRLAITQTALDKIKSHAEKNSYTFTEAIKISCENGWAGFNVSWIDNTVEQSKAKLAEGFL